MKKTVLSAFTAILVIALSICAFAETGVIWRGDVNRDGILRASDARTILRISAKLEPTPTGTDFDIADVDEDGHIRAKDARLALRMSAKLERAQPFYDVTKPAEPTTAPAPEITTVHPTEPATVPTTVPTTIPATEPTAAPTTEPAPEPTTVPTTVPTTEPSTVPTTEPSTVPSTEAPSEPASEAAKPDPVTEPDAPEPAEKLTPKEIYRLSNSYTVEINTVITSTSGAVGSGFFITGDGQVVTNYHVIEGAKEITVTDCDGVEHAVTQVLAYDESLDLAVLKVDASVTPAVVEKQRPETADKIYTLGSSEGMTDSFSDGLVSNPNRVRPWYVAEHTLIQITAPISHGNSGGPLINERGEVIGVNAFGEEEGQNLNFAIPAEYLDELDYSSPLNVADFAKISSETKVKTTFQNIDLLPGGTAMIPLEISGTSETSINAEYDNTVFDLIWSDDEFTSYEGHTIYYVIVTALGKKTTDAAINITADSTGDVLLSIPATVSDEGNPFFYGYPGLPDFGAATGISPSGFGFGDTSYVFGFDYFIGLFSKPDETVKAFVSAIGELGYALTETYSDSGGAQHSVYTNADGYELDISARAALGGKTVSIIYTYA